MTSVEARGISVVELAESIRSAEPRARLVEPRVLRRVVRGVLGIERFFGHVPHRGGLATTGASALAFAERDELGLPPEGPVPDFLILLAGPDLDRVEDLPRRDVLVRYWRALFHARVHLAYAGRPDFDDPGAAWVAERVERLGRVEFAEARAVLVEDSYLSLPADDRTTFVEFAAVYLELLAFHPALLPRTFPAIHDHEAVRRMLAADVDPEALLEATRLPGSPTTPATEAEPAEDRDDEPIDEGPPEAHPWRVGRLRRRADSASRRGNNVRAAILRAQASSRGRGGERARDRAGARDELDALARRLRAVVEADAAEAARWRRVLPAFLPRAAGGHWSREARLLHDLQKACLDRERPISAIDLVGWLTSLGRRPIRRPMPDQREVMVLKHLRSAARRVRQLHGPEPAREDVERLIGLAVDRHESALRERFRGRISAILDRVPLRPRNLPERAARRKLVEELLDLIVARGFLRIGDLRDAISRNQVKLPDLSGPAEFLRGDPLLRADAALAADLDGVYHRGEVYLRALQRASSLAFGTPVGRWLSRYLALPFGGAFLVLEGLQHIVGPIAHALGGVEPHIFNPISHAVVGLLLLGLINHREFRGAFSRSFRAIGRGLKGMFFDAPRWLLDRPIVRWVVNSRSFLVGWNWLLKPFLLLVLVNLGVRALLPRPSPRAEVSLGLPRDLWRAIEAAAWVLLAALVNSRSGRDFEEIAADGASRVGQRIWRDLIPNVFRGILDFFHAALELVERALYGVDEWLRFRGGDARITLAAKAVLGLAWAVVAYVARIYINLLIEPQANPIKHFPVVTVSHKIILPMSVTLIRIVRVPLMPIGNGLATTIATTTVFLLPGVFGFLAWELKENWRLYAANRPPALGPVPIGHHGETMGRLLRRGFHSGTVPKLFARLRKAERGAELGRGSGPSHKRIEDIRHVGEAVRRFVERGVVYVLEESRSVAPSRPVVGEVACATNRIVVELRDRDDPSTSARIAFEESGRQLRARVDEPGWLAGLGDEPRRALASAVSGLYAMAGADLAIEPGSGLALEARSLRPEWSAWVAAWERDADGLGHPAVVPEGCRLLPEPEVSAATPGR